MDTATSEYLFCCSFFQEDAIFHELFAATLAVVESSLAAALQVRAMLTLGAMQGCTAVSCPGVALLCFAQRARSEAILPQETFDLVGLLLMIRVNYHHQLLMAKRRIPCLDDYLDRINLLLWPRFKVSAMRATCCQPPVRFAPRSTKLAAFAGTALLVGQDCCTLLSMLPVRLSRRCWMCSCRASRAIMQPTGGLKSRRTWSRSAMRS